MTTGRTRRGPARTAGIAPIPVTPSDPFQILCAEHALLQRDFARLLADSHEGQAEGAVSELLVSLSLRFQQHLSREELILYPVCERLFGGRDGPARVLREDHEDIRGRLGALVDEAGQPSHFSRARLDMLRLQVAEHFGKEERVLFPLTRALLSGTESGSLARRLRAPSER